MCPDQSQEKGKISVNSVPKGADIFLDCNPTGKHTNATLDNVDDGEHTILVYLKGHGSDSKTVTVTKGKEEKVKCYLEDNRWIYPIGVVTLVVCLIIVGVLCGFGFVSFVSPSSPAFNATSSSSSNSTTSSAAGTTASGIGIFAIFYLLAQFIERVIEIFSNSRLLGGNDDEDEKNPKNRARAVSLWCIASGFGIVACYLTVGLLQVLGITFIFSAIQGHLLDAIISGVVVGSGTKPLHDLINLIDNKSNSST